MPGRVIVLDGELLENDPSSMGKTQGGHITRTVAYPTLCPYVFHRNRKPIKDYGKAHGTRHAKQPGCKPKYFTTSGARL